MEVWIKERVVYLEDMTLLALQQRMVLSPGGLGRSPGPEVSTQTVLGGSESGHKERFRDRPDITC